MAEEYNLIQNQWQIAVGVNTTADWLIFIEKQSLNFKKNQKSKLILAIKIF